MTVGILRKTGISMSIWGDFAPFNDNKFNDNLLTEVYYT